MKHKFNFSVILFFNNSKANVGFVVTVESTHDRDTYLKNGMPDFIVPTSSWPVKRRRSDSTFHVLHGEGEEEDGNY